MLPSGSDELRASTTSRKSTVEKENEAFGGLFDNTSHHTPTPATMSAIRRTRTLNNGPLRFFAAASSYSSSPPGTLSSGSADSSSIESPRDRRDSHAKRVSGFGYRRKVRTLFEPSELAGKTHDSGCR